MQHWKENYLIDFHQIHYKLNNWASIDAFYKILVKLALRLRTTWFEPHTSKKRKLKLYIYKHY